MKKIFFRAVALLLMAALLLSGCQRQSAGPVYTKYSDQFFGAFDTIIQLVGYTETQEQFEEHTAYAQQRFVELSQLFDRFYEYDGIHNVCTVNKNAGIAPVKVDPLLLDLVELCREWYTQTDGQIDIAMGSVLEVWHSYMAAYAGETNGVIPTREELETAAQVISMEDVVVDREAGTLYLQKPGMLLDLGGAAKGYATQIVSDELYQRGLKSHLLSAGGNVVAGDPPLDGIRNAWGVGIQDPFADMNDPEAKSLDAVFVKNQSVVTSGDYQRFYMTADGQRMHHIIDPDTYMPASYYRGLTVITEDSGMADIFSTALFCMDYPASRAFAEAHDLKVLWVFPDGSVEYTDNLLPMLRDRGGATAAIPKEPNGWERFVQWISNL